MSSSSGDVGGVFGPDSRAAVLSVVLCLLFPPKMLLVSDVKDDTNPLVTDADES